MTTLPVAARSLRLLALAVWLGAIVFFGAVVAPTAARTFGNTEQFADFIGGSLLRLHSIGLWCGVAILVALRLLASRAYRMPVQAGLALLMMVLTFVSNRAIILPMEHDRALAGGNISVMLSGSPIREDFDARHAWSTRVEGAVLLCGLALAVLVAVESDEKTFVAAGGSKKVFDLSGDS